MKQEDNIAILITKDRQVWLNLNEPVGSVLLKKVAEILEILEKKQISQDSNPNG